MKPHSIPYYSFGITYTPNDLITSIDNILNGDFIKFREQRINQNLFLRMNKVITKSFVFLDKYKEWTILKKFLDISTGGWKLKSVKGWNKWKDEYGKIQNGNGENLSGFNALPGGFRDDDGTGIDVAIFWSATEIKTSRAWTLILTNDTGFLHKTWAFKQEGLSVRCIKNSSVSKWVQRVIR